MSGNTTKWTLPFLQASDPVAQTDDIDAARSARLDLLLGEYGFITVSPAANTTVATGITLSRTYPGNNTVADRGGIVIVNLNATLSAATGFSWWVSAFTGSTTTITGFTLSAQFTAVQAGRVLVWRYLPVSL